MRENILGYLENGPRSPRDIEGNARLHGFRGTYEELMRLIKDDRVEITSDFKFALKG